MSYRNGYDSMLNDWYEVIIGKAVFPSPLPNSGITISLPDDTQVSTLCTLCAQFLNEWQACGFFVSHDEEVVRPKMGSRWEKEPRDTWPGPFQHHQSLVDLADSAIGQCGLCQVFLLTFIDLLENKTKSYDGYPRADLEPNMEIKINCAKVPTEPVSFRLGVVTGAGTGAQFSFPIVFPAPEMTVKNQMDWHKNRQEVKSREHYHLLLYLTTPKPWTGLMVDKRPQHQPNLALPSRNSVDLIGASALAMMRSCRDNHAQCSQSRADPGFKPSRMIDVGSVSNPVVRVVETKRMSRDQYVALSYCWGPTNEFQLKKSNLKSCLSSIPEHMLPLTIVDAIKFTRALGFRYIWIDAICIVQDDAQDWEYEALQMRQVYQCAELCISALRSPTSVYGLFPESNKWQGIRVAIGRDREEFLLQVYDFKSTEGEYFSNTLENSPMTSRGWTMQERLLSRRILHIGDVQTVFECRRQVIEECGLVMDSRRDGMLSLRDLHNTLETAPRTEILFTWYRIIHEYGYRNFRHESDRLSAFDGMRELFQPALNSPYFYGLWMADIYTGLLWFRVSGSFGTWSMSLLDFVAFTHPGLFDEKCPQCIDMFESGPAPIPFVPNQSLKLGTQASWSWAAALPGRITFLLRDNGIPLTESDEPPPQLTVPREPTAVKFTVLQVGHLQTSSTIRPFIQIKGVMISLNRSADGLNLGCRWQVGEILNREPQCCHLAFNGESRGFPDHDDLDLKKIRCSGLITCQALVPCYDESTDSFVNKCTLTIMLVRKSQQDSKALQAIGVNPHSVFERIGIAFLQDISLGDFLNARVACREEDEIYLI